MPKHTSTERVRVMVNGWRLRVRLAIDKTKRQQSASFAYMTSVSISDKHRLGGDFWVVRYAV